MNRAFVAEIVGPAGAGKSTLARALAGRAAGGRAALGVWGLPKRLLLVGALASLPRLAGLCRGGRPAGLEEAKLVVRLEALARRVARESSRRGLLLLDEGAVFALAKLLTTGGACETRARELAGRCARMLDAVVWLDAPDAVLARRIRGRDKPHRVKAQSDEEIAAFLARYRESYERVLAEMCAHSDLKIIRLSADGETPGRVAERVLSIVEGAAAGRGAPAGGRGDARGSDARRRVEIAGAG
jgi:shikimate kinase